MSTPPPGWDWVESPDFQPEGASNGQRYRLVTPPSTDHGYKMVSLYWPAMRLNRWQRIRQWFRSKR